MTHKKDGSVRICIDPNELNKALLRERFTMPVMEDILHELKDARIFSKADLSSGYWHIELDEESSRLTSFMTPFGRYRWLRLPFGLSVSAEIFQRNLIEALRDLPGVLCIADDVIIHGSNQEEHDARLSSFLSRCNEMGIMLNKQKFEHATDSICFMGHRITSKGLEADPAKIKAVAGMERPEDVPALRRFLGMVNYLNKFIPNLADVLQPLHQLTKKDVPYTWSSLQENAFLRVKELLCNTPVLAYYNPEEPLLIENDASEHGLGSVLLQGGRPLA